VKGCTAEGIPDCRLEYSGTLSESLRTVTFVERFRRHGLCIAAVPEWDGSLFVYF